MFNFSVGCNRYDNTPQVRCAATLRGFASAVLSRRAKDKTSAGYITAAFAGDGRRSAANAVARNWVALDVDGIDPSEFVSWRLFLTRWRGFGWPTASSTPETPRERIIIELSEPIDRAQGIGIGALILRDVAENFGAAVRIDACGFRAEQPAFLAPVGVRPFYLLGDALDVGVWLAQAPPAPPSPPSAGGIAAELADARMRAVVEQLGDAGLLRMLLPNERGYSMVCPWERLHTSETGLSSTALLFPADGNAWRGAFSCLHSHCRGRSLRDVVALLERAAKEAA